MTARPRLSTGPRAPTALRRRVRRGLQGPRRGPRGARFKPFLTLTKCITRTVHGEATMVRGTGCDVVAQ